MVFLFYNKWLLRLIVLLSGAGIGLAALRYIALSSAKLPDQGWRDALAIASFLIAGWLVMLLAEVVDNHYVRALGCLCAMLGSYVSYKWIFVVDGPKLRELPNGYLMGQVSLGFWGALALAALMFALLVTRLILDKLNAGRTAYSHSTVNASPNLSPPGREAQLSRPVGALPPIPVDLSPMGVAGSTASRPAEPSSMQARTVAPVARLVGIGGLYLGSTYPLNSGVINVGRQDAEVLLNDDSQVSRRHAAINVGEDGIATVTDLGSTNGSYLNDQRITSAQLAPGDVLRFGASMFRVEG